MTFGAVARVDLFTVNCDQFVAGGTITLLSGSPITCTSTAAFDVLGTVALAGGGSATFHVRLTHYQTRVFGVCVPYFATIKGSVTLATP